MAVPEWPEPTRSPQRLDVLLKGTWSLRVSAEALHGFHFEGQCVTSPLTGLAIYGEFKHRSSFFQSVPLQWTAHPPLPLTCQEGWGILASHEPPLLPTLHCTLFCAPEGLAWVYRAFLAAFAIAKNRVWPLALHLQIDPPEAGLPLSGVQPVEAFWRERWQHEPWRVVRWQLHMNVEQSDQ